MKYLFFGKNAQVSLFLLNLVQKLLEYYQKAKGSYESAKIILLLNNVQNSIKGKRGSNKCLFFFSRNAIFFAVTQLHIHYNTYDLDMELIAFGKNLDTLTYEGFKQGNVFNIRITCP